MHMASKVLGETDWHIVASWDEWNLLRWWLRLARFAGPFSAE